MDYNIPINDVARKIRDDAHELLKVIDKLQDENPKNDAVEEWSFNYKQIKTDIKIQDQWCHYCVNQE